ncbi:hypothetical protein [Nostoc punctiforme]|uniref:hypothetical protein n=1 Tax=Nostoc punctiforme TaxID=272131 RepID=UPI001427C240|nr:hypothetical protein [Nostoc punctiforme]
MPTVSRQSQVIPHPLTTSAIAESPADMGYWSYEWRIGGRNCRNCMKNANHLAQALNWLF